MGLVSMWEHLSHAVMGVSVRPEKSAAAAELDAALRHLFPGTHGAIPRADREALVRRQICTRQDVSRFEYDDDITSALPDVSLRTRTKLYYGKQSTGLGSDAERPAPLSFCTKLLKPPYFGTRQCCSMQGAACALSRMPLNSQWHLCQSLTQ